MILIIKVPVGTQVFDETREYLLADFTKAGQEIRMLRGGRWRHGQRAL